MRPAARPSHGAGVSLIELLIATCIAAVTLAGAWGWVWNAGVTARAIGSRAQASTADDFAVRVIADDVAQAAGVLPTPAGRLPLEAFSVIHRHPGEAAETVTIVWDRARRVLWRKASGTYLADQVTGFSVRYFAADGAELAGDVLRTAQGAARVARLEVTLAGARGGRTATRVLHACVGPA